MGHTVSASGITPLSTTIQAITDFPPPTTITELQRFLGLINFYRCFLPAAAAVLKPLTDALAGTGTKKRLTWTTHMQQSFSSAKQLLSKATLLAHPHPTAAVSIASDAHVGGVLQQWSHGGWQPLSFYSAKLTSAQQNYSTFDRELQAAYNAVLHFRSHIEGRHFQLHTDYKPLIYALICVTPPKSVRQQRQLAFLAEFDITPHMYLARTTW